MWKECTTRSRGIGEPNKAAHAFGWLQEGPDQRDEEHNIVLWEEDKGACSALYGIATSATQIRAVTAWQSRPVLGFPARLSVTAAIDRPSTQYTCRNINARFYARHAP